MHGRQQRQREDARQNHFDYPRAEQLGYLRDCELPNVKTKDQGVVTGKLLKAVLTRLDDHGGGRECYLSAETIAAEAGMSLRHAKRAVEALRSLSLICAAPRRTPRGSVCNHYRIVWSELALLCRPRQRANSPTDSATKRADSFQRVPSAAPGESGGATKPPAGEFSTPQSVVSVGDQSARLSDQSARLSKQSAMLAPEAPYEAPYEAPPPPTPPNQSGDRALPLGDWRVAGEELQRAGIGAWRKVLSQARARGQPAGEFLAHLHGALATVLLPENVPRLKDPTKSLAWYLLNGRWPVDDVVSPQEASQRHEDARRREQIEAMRLRVFSIIREGRKQGLVEEVIQQQLRTELPEWFLRAEGRW